MNNNEILDITSLKHRGPELHKAIEQAVRDTQAVLIRTLPDQLNMTVKQFESLMGTENTKSYLSAVELGSKKAYIFYTPMNAMEVNVVDKENMDLLV